MHAVPLSLAKLSHKMMLLLLLISTLLLLVLLVVAPSSAVVPHEGTATQEYGCIYISRTIIRVRVVSIPQMQNWYLRESVTTYYYRCIFVHAEDTTGISCSYKIYDTWGVWPSYLYVSYEHQPADERWRRLAILPWIG